jgi:hypothetical protein
MARNNPQEVISPNECSWSSAEDKEWDRISRSIRVVSRNASFIRTESSMGFTSRFAAEDDIICTLLGCSVPVILRPCIEQPEFYHFVVNVILMA